MKKLLMVLASSLMLLAGCSSGTSSTDSANPAAKTEEKSEITIGMYGGFTGATAFWNTRGQQGVELAVKEINENGGINGKQVKVLFEDTQGNKTQDASAVEKLIKQNKVDVVFGGPVSGSNFVGIPIAESAKIPFIGISPSAKGIPKQGEYIFRTGSLSEFATPMLLNHMIDEEGVKNLVIINSINNDYSIDQTKMTEAVAKEKGINLKTVSISDGDTDFTSQVATVVKENPDAVFLATYGTEGGLLVKGLRSEGYNGIVFGTDAIAEQPFFDLGKEATEGTLLWMPWVPDTTDAGIKEFVDKFSAAYDVEPEFIAAFGYDTVYMLKEVMEKAGTTDPEKVREGLMQVKGHTGIIGEVNFDAESREFLHEHYIVKIENGQYVPVTKK